MDSYHSLMRRILEQGVRRPNRTGVDTLMVPAATLSFDLREGFPAITTKKLAFAACKGELLGFFRGYQSAAEFRALSCRVWDANANETPAWLANPNRRGPDDLGRIYGAQWTDWQDWREMRVPQQVRLLAVDLDRQDGTPPAPAHLLEQARQFRRFLRETGYEVVMADGDRVIVRRGINQLERALYQCRFEPDDRRILVSAWRPDEFDRMALPPCHVLVQFLPVPAQRLLHLTMYQRSCDVFLGLPFNIASYALLACIMGRLAGLTPATLTLFLGDVHIYVNHLDQVHEQLRRTPYPAPALHIAERIGCVQSPADIRGAFARIEPDDLQLVGYRSWPALPAPIAV